ncbi:two-component system response regulator [Neobacillus piezotolerans]|uniref:Two-component system response regulator n=1 Tax=Neobacillus piezotolerans TaxID=2259171 RepID=A0A3D8GUX2_9BACI|nr:response regulator [Neobacillus piezotolerans]RDU38284.1 two-component system response regulator [Neobacillus piezotolerans]
MDTQNNIEVLIVEDDLRVAEIQTKFIEQVGGFTTVGIAASYEEAKSYIDIMEPDLVLLDVYFPDMDGMDLLRELKQRKKKIDIIMITATKEFDRVQEAVTIGVFDFIIKPVIFERFKQALVRYRDYYFQLHNLGRQYSSVTQHQVDMLLRKEAGILVAEKTHLPKGIDPLTLEKVLDVLAKADSGLTAELVAVEIGVSRTTGRRYLEYLVSEEKVDADLSYGTVGRPERVYLVKEK